MSDSRSILLTDLLPNSADLDQNQRAPDHRVGGALDRAVLAAGHRTPAPVGHPHWPDRCLMFGNTDAVLARRIVTVARPILGLGLVISACSPSGPSSATKTVSPQSACSLLTAQEASNALGETVQAPSQCATSPGDQSSGIYRLSAGPGTMVIRVSWNKRTTSSFTVAHSGKAKYLDGAVPPTYAEVTVGGVPAYWQLSPAAGPGGARNLSSSKDGYVVTITSMGLGRSQVGQALADMLNHL